MKHIFQVCENFLSEKDVVGEGLIKTIATISAAIELGIIINYIHKKRDICLKVCSESSMFNPKKQKICLAKCRIEVYKRAVSLTQEGMHKCHKAKHPDLCKYKFQKFLDHYKDKLFSQELLLRKLVKEK